MNHIPLFHHLSKKWQRLSRAYQVLVVLIAILILGGGAFAATRSGNGSDKLVAVTRGSVAEEITLIGTVRPAQAVELSFTQDGRIGTVLVRVGDHVEKGTVLVTLENADVAGKLAAEQARLSEALRGTRSESLAIEEAKMRSAREDQTNAEVTLMQALRNAYSNADDAVRSKADQLFANPRTTSISFGTSLSNTELRFTIEAERHKLEQLFAEWERGLDTLSTSTLASEYKRGKSTLGVASSLLSHIAEGLSSLSSSVSIQGVTVSTARSDIATGRSNVNAALVDMQSTYDDWQSAVLDAETAVRELTLARAGSSAETIAIQRGVVTQYTGEYEKTLIRAPISGIVSKLDARPGELAEARAVITGIIAESPYTVETQVPELDIARITLGDRAEVSLDAYGPELRWEATVTEIEPAETLIDSVATYKTTFAFNGSDPRIRSGMTANVRVRGRSKADVLLIPTAALKLENGERVVQVLRNNDELVSVPVSLGLIGDGVVEITSGLREGDRVLVPQAGS